MIYFAQHLETEFIKIGYTRHIIRVEKRLKAEYGNVKLIGAMEGGYTDENGLHHKFDCYSIHECIEVLPETNKRRGWGIEWFIPCDEILSYITLNSQENLMYSTVSEPGGKQPKTGTKLTDSMIFSCTPEMRQMVNGYAEKLHMSPARLLRFMIEEYSEIAVQDFAHRYYRKLDSKWGM